jgi:hypothetical protein
MRLFSGSSRLKDAPLPKDAPILRPFDIGAILFAILSTVVAAALVYRAPAEAASRFCIQGEGGRWVYPQKSRERVDVQGPLGTTVIELSEGRARISASPCAAQTCVHAAPVQRPGQWIACLPNGVLVSLEVAAANSQDALDALAW